MKLQISFDLIDLEKAIAIGSEVAQYADIIEVGTILIYHHGTAAIKQFKEAFPDKVILADTKIVDRGKEVVELFAQAGADWITVMAGTSPHVIHATTTAAHSANVKVMLDLIDSDSVGQSAQAAPDLFLVAGTSPTRLRPRPSFECGRRVFWRAFAGKPVPAVPELRAALL